METHKAFVREDGSTVLKCPHCGHARTVSVQHVKDKKKTIKVKCLCKKSYSVALELRRMFRKSTSLKGKYTNLSLDDDSGPMIVQDVSMGGIGFEILGEILLEKEHDLEVTFTLDDKDSSFIRKLVVVKIVKGRYVGCEFKSSFGYDKALGFYLTP
jgi:hypothetical protein